MAQRREARAVMTLLEHRAGMRGHLVDAAGARWTCAEVVDALAAGGRVREELERSISSTPWSGVFWECRPMQGATAYAADFEWVVLHSPAVARLRPDPQAFAAHLAGSEEVATFPNLGGDAILVAPAPGGDGEQSAHLLSFLRTAGARRRAALWAAVGEAAAGWLSARPDETLWMSTSGLGVSWLHVRLDRRPKYITWRPYRSQ